MSFVMGLRCRECGREYPKEVLYVCEFCFGSLEVVYDYDKIKKEISRELIQRRSPNLWRYRELLPIDSEPLYGLHSGFTPLIVGDKLAKILKVDNIYIKDDSVNHPTFSFKDRVVSTALAKAKEFGFDTVACASTGNLAHSVSALSAKAGLRSFVFIPADLELGKIIATLVYKPNLVAVEGNYDEVNRLCAEVVTKYRWAFVNVNIRPYYAEGSKTYAFEIAEQLGWRAPRHVVVPLASGSLYTKIWKGFKEFYKLGLIDELNTKAYAAQAEGCSPISSAIKEGSDIIKPIRPNTIAKSLAIGNPADGYYAMETCKESGGWAETANDDEIIEGIKLLAQSEGIFTEPAGGVTVAVTKKLIEKGVIPPNEDIVVCITGNGLKTQEAVKERIGQFITIKPTLDSFEKGCKDRGIDIG